MDSQSKSPESQHPDKGASSITDSDVAARHQEVERLLTEARSLRRRDYDRVQSLADRAFELACQPDIEGRQDTEGMASALSVLAHRSCVLGDSEAALSQASQALGLLASNEPSTVLGEIFDTTGWSHFLMGDYAEAYEYLLRALAIAEAIEDRSMQAYVMDSLGNVQSSSGHTSDAFEMQTRALAIHRELGDLVGEATTLNNMTYTCMDLGDLDTALECARSAADYCEKAGRPLLLVGVMDTLCDVYMALDDPDSAEKYARRGLEIAAEHGWRADETNCGIGLARVALARGDQLDDALTLAKLALGLAEKDKRVREQAICHKLISEVSERQGDYATALVHYRRFHELEHARLDDVTQIRMANLRVEHQLETARKDAEIHRLRSIALEQEVEERRLAQAELEAHASLDPLTGLFNRGHLVVIAEDVQLSQVEGRPTSLIILDVDAFKSINDTYGHRAGDQVLVSVARDVTDSVREADVTCRYGGDEFLVYLADTGREDAIATAERIREAIAARAHNHRGDRIAVTASLGVATAASPASTTLETLIERADRALYAAKRGGRDRVIAAPL